MAKLTVGQRIQAVKRYLDGHETMDTIAKESEVTPRVMVIKI